MTLNIQRFEAEAIIDLIESHSTDLRLLWFSNDLRKQFGMVVLTKDELKVIHKRNID